MTVSSPSSANLYIGKCCEDRAGNLMCNKKGTYKLRYYSRDESGGTKVYKTCETKGCGLKLYKTCANPACGVKTYKYCWHY